MITVTAACHGPPFARWPRLLTLWHACLPAPICAAGVTALYAAMHCPHVFGAVLAESPSLWIAEGKPSA